MGVGMYVIINQANTILEGLDTFLYSSGKNKTTMYWQTFVLMLPSIKVCTSNFYKSYS